MFSSAPSAPVIDLLYLFTGVPLAHSQPPCAPVVDLLPVTYFSFSPAYRSLLCAPVVDLFSVTFELGDL